MTLRLTVAACAMAIRLFAAAPTPLKGGIGFTENKGQFPPNVRFAMESGSVYLTSNAVVLAPELATIEFDGGNPAAAVSPTDTQAYVVNTYSGSDPARWVTGARVFGRVQYFDVWPGIDVTVSPEALLTIRFIVRPGDAAAIRLKYSGTGVGFGLARETLLLLHFTVTRIGQSVNAYQEIKGGRMPVAVKYTAAGDNRFSVELGAYDRSLPVIVENGLPHVSELLPPPRTISRSGAMYGANAAGALVTTSLPIEAQLPQANICSFQMGVRPCGDLVVSGYSSDGQLRYLTRLHGTLDEAVAAIDVDASETVTVIGQTNSPDFPTTGGAAQARYAGPAPRYDPYHSPIDPARGDAFLAKLDGNTGRLLYSTYLGGPEEDSATSLRIDTAGNTYIGGPTSSALPVTSGALSRTPCMWQTPPPVRVFPCALGYVAKMDSAGRLVFLTYLPGKPDRFAADGEGSVYFGGSAAAGEIAATPGAYRSAPDGARSAFVAKLNLSGSSLRYATYFGGPDHAAVADIAVDSEGNAWFLSMRTEDPTTNWIYPSKRPRLAKLNATGSAVLYETPFLEGTLAVDARDRLVVLTKFNFHQVSRTPKGTVNSVCGDMAVTLLDRDGTVLLNRAGDFGAAAALTSDAQLFYGGYTEGAWKFGPQSIEPSDGPDAACLLNAASLTARNRLAPGEIFTVLGVGIGPKSPAAFQLDSRGMVPTSLDGLRVLVDGVPVPVLYADYGQVNAIAPFTLTAASFSLEIDYQGRRTPAIAVTAAETESGLFTVDGSGAGQALAFNEDGTLNSPANPARLGSIVTLFATGTGATDPASAEGAVARSTDARPVRPPSVFLGGIVGGIPTEILYYGPSPGSLTSVTQINLRLPASVAESLVTYPLTAWPLLFTGAPFYKANIALKN